jgi:polyisoprenoid-binding protein YceI
MAAGLAAYSSAASAQEFHVDLEAENVVRFLSRAPIDQFDGVTDRIDGYVLLDRESLNDSVGGADTEFYFEVDLASLDTGIGLRNRHMRDNYLEVERYPYATFGGSINQVVATGSDTLQVTVDGVMSIHGVDRPLGLTCAVTERGRGYRAACSFQILLSDYNIKIPKVMFLKLADEIRLELDFAVEPASGGPGDNQ